MQEVFEWFKIIIAGSSLALLMVLGNSFYTLNKERINFYRYFNQRDEIYKEYLDLMKQYKPMKEERCYVS